MNFLPYDAYFKRFGVKSPQHLLVPVVLTIDKFVFPKNTVHHFVIYDAVTNGPSNDEYFYRTISKKIPIQHVMDLTDFKGMPKKLSIPLIPYIREYQLKNKRFRLNDEAVTKTTDENTPVVVNYGFAMKSYRYMRNIYTEYNKWWNLEKTVWDTIRNLTQVSQRQHFVFMTLPKVLPPPSKLNAGFNQQLLKTFGTPDALFIREIWNWLGEGNRNETVFGEFTQDSLDKINIVVQDSGRFVILNLGLLNKWRADGVPLPNQKIKIEPKDLQKRVLRLFLTLVSLRDQVLENDPDAPVQSEDTVTGAEDELSKQAIALSLLEDLDKVLEFLETSDKKRNIEETETGVKSDTVIHSDKVIDFGFFDNEKSPEEIINQTCDDLAVDGVISAVDFRKFTRLADNYKNITAPDGKTPLGEYVTIGPEELQITESRSIPDKETILDKTMLKSSLLDFDERYIKTVMARDVSGMVVNTQKAGFIINKYEVEKVEDVLGGYEVHTVRVSPISGSPSTLRFRLPLVNEDGVYKRNGIRYRMRKQRGD